LQTPAAPLSACTAPPSGSRRFEPSPFSACSALGAVPRWPSSSAAPWRCSPRSCCWPMMLSEERRKRLSKFLSLILRHRPEKFGLRLDEHGFAPLEELLAVVRREREWEQVTEEQTREVVANSDKQRFEIAGSNIRARYGHSAPQRITYPEAEPPDILYHGTSPQSLPSIRTEGLRPMRRQYVHLSTSTEQAREVGRRHSREPVLLTVRARAARRAGGTFYH